MSVERIKNLLPSKVKRKAEGSNAIIYTRVSTSKQVDNTSLDYQLQKCRELCRANNYTIVAEFGGTHESAKSDLDRKEFMKMKSFALNEKNKVRYVVTNSADRFSRTTEAILTVNQFRSKNIKLLLVNIAIDDSSPSGQFVMDLQFLLSNLDNNLRKEKITAGMIAKLRQGYFPFAAPLGYSNSDTPGLKVPNDKAQFIKLAFELKAQGYSHDQISHRLRTLGFTISIKRLSAIFLNAFYCGVLCSTLIEEGIVEGKHQPIISQELFEQVNANKAIYSNTKSQKSDFDPFPLTGFLICASCGKKWTAYTVRKKKIDYYKCNTRGCKCNRNVKYIHAEFANKLREYVVPDALALPLKEQLKLVFRERNLINAKERAELQQRLIKVQEYLDKVNLRFGIGEIGKEAYQASIRKLQTDEKQLIGQIAEADFQISNHRPFIDFAISLSGNLDQAWVSADTRVKRLLQKVIFPEGITYDNHSHSYRTPKVNGMFSIFRSVSESYNRKGEEQQCHPSPNSGLVVPTGLLNLLGIKLISENRKRNRNRVYWLSYLSKLFCKNSIIL